ncbi:MAG: SMC-Scp complex subunit ScpB [Malacoplasma sp.]|nr:SMC-Scp complex subunit ScpB [Malacoplasma sp.]
MEKNNKAIIEGLLFVAGVEGLEISDLKKVLEIPTDDIRKLIKEMQNDYKQNPNSGLAIEIFGDKYKILTKQELNEIISKVYEIKTRNALSQAMMEALAIIAYNAPCPGSKVEQIRGKDASSVIARLQALGLIENKGRATTPGCPYLYDVTSKFFDHFGIKSLSELPKIDEQLFNEEINTNEDFFDSKRKDADKE